MKLVTSTRNSAGTLICQPYPLVFSSHSMMAADTGPTSTQYQLAPASRKSGAALVFVPAVIEISSPAVLDAKPPGSLPGEVRVGVAAVQYEHPTGDQHRPDDT